MRRLEKQMLEGGVRHFFHRLRLRTIWSWEGIRAAWATEHSFRTWIWAQGISIALSLLLPFGAVERALLWSLGFLVIAAELVNTAIEATVDRVGTETHPLAKIAKDAGSAGVAVAGVAAGVAWVALLVGLVL